MLRIICKQDREYPPHYTQEGTYHTFLLSAAEVEEWLHEPETMNDYSTRRHIIGVEVVPDEKGGA